MARQTYRRCGPASDRTTRRDRRSPGRWAEETCGQRQWPGQRPAHNAGGGKRFPARAWKTTRIGAGTLLPLSADFSLLSFPPIAISWRALTEHNRISYEERCCPKVADPRKGARRCLTTISRL